MKFLCSFIMFIARLCIAAVFLFGAISSFMNYDQTIQYMTSKGFTVAVPLFLFGAALVQIVGALSLILGYRTRLGATLLLLFLIPTTIIFHDFWNLAGADQANQLINFLKNLAIFGGLLYVACHGSGCCACDAFRCRHKETVETVETPEKP